jgi:hypothetical protein
MRAGTTSEDNFFEKFFDKRPSGGPEREWEAAGAAIGGLGEGEQ